MLAKERRRRRDSKRLSKSMAGMEEEILRERDGDVWKALYEEQEVKHHLKDGGDIPKVLSCQGGVEKLKHLNDNRKSIEDVQWDQDALEKIIEKYKAMESKLLIGGKTIIDHTNEQQKMLELKRQEIAEQIRREREIQQQMMLQDEETGEMRETFSSLQHEVEVKTKKLKRLYSKLQMVKGETKDVIAEHVTTRQELEQTQNELTRELKYKYLLIENFIPPEEKNKIMNRLHFDSEEDQWRLQPVLPESAPTQVKRRPLSAVGYKRPISQYAQMAVATATGAPCRYQAENIMLLELDMSPPTMFTLNLNGTHLERAFSPRLIRDILANVPVRERSGAVATSQEVTLLVSSTASSIRHVILIVHRSDVRISELLSSETKTILRCLSSTRRSSSDKPLIHRGGRP
ncbi:Kinesin-like protein KIF3C [Collichthys lucidus]|uniref:Kinesin-like protein KIF3C n=1 Tax=Collichthys lucidus TaxID=240159 RepID=A0A4U5VFT3_COLLU|nr:Kinesin-like protein KIF3C [Collichthys lucidus]